MIGLFYVIFYQVLLILLNTNMMTIRYAIFILF